MSRRPKTYNEVTDEWLAWNTNAGQAAPKFGTVQEYAKFMDGREQEPSRSAAYDPNVAQQVDRFIQNKVLSVDNLVKSSVMPMTGVVTPFLPKTTEATTGDVGAGFGGVAGEMLEKAFPSQLPTMPAPRHPTLMQMFPDQVQEVTPNPETVDVMTEAGRGLPRAAGQVGLMSTGPIGMAAGLADTALAAYAPQKDAVAGVVAPLTMAAGMKAVPIAGRMGENVAARAFQPAFQELVQLPSQAYGKAAAGMLRPNALAENAVSAGRIGAEAVTGTAIGEAGRVTEQALKGEDVTVFDPASIAANLVSTAAFAPLDIATRRPPDKVVQEKAMRAIAEADKSRAVRMKLNDTRGQRIADTHARLRDAIKRGEDPTQIFNEAREHYIEADAVRQPTLERAAGILTATENDANSGRMSELELHTILNAVQGRFDEIAKSDPESREVGTVSGRAIGQLIKDKLLPPISEEWVRTNFKEAYEQALMNGPAARANLVNRIVAYYQEILPAALEARQKLPRAGDAMSKEALDAQVEADKDVAYMQALLSLYPHMAGKKAPAPEGTDVKLLKDLDEELWNRDVELSAATGGNQLKRAETAWAVYDSWKDAIIRLAQTYDPVTRTGEWRPSRRMADGTVIEGSAQRMSIEDLVKRSADKGPYKVNVMAKRKIDQSVPTTSLDEMLQFVGEKFGDKDVDETIESLQDPEKADQFAKERRKTTRDEAPSLENEERLNKIDASREADEAGLTGEERLSYIKTVMDELSNANQPLFGFDLKATNKEEFYDIALWLVDKVEKTDNLALWQQHGSHNLFGRGATSPGKAELFKDAILARIEAEADDTGRLSVAQKRFYDGWRKFADEKEGAKSEPGKTWEQQRAQFRHALRLYWRQVPDIGVLVQNLLAEKPDYLNMLRAGSIKQRPVGAEGTSNAELTPLPGKPHGMGTQIAGQRDFITDSFRLFRGYARKLGSSEQDADNYGILISKLAQDFNEAALVGRLVSSETALGMNFPPFGKEKQNWIGINFDRIDAVERGMQQRLVKALQLFAHELAHNYTVHERPSTVYSQQRADAHAKLRGLFEELGPEATDQLLNDVIAEVFIPPQFQMQGRSNLIYPGASFTDEAVSKLMEYVMLGAYTKSHPSQKGVRQGAATAEEAFLWLPNEVQAYSRLAFRDITNFLGGLEDYYKNVAKNEPQEGVYKRQEEDVRKQAATVRAFLRPMMEYAKDFVNYTTAKDLEYTTVGKNLAAKISAAGSVDWNDPIIVRSTRLMDHRELNELAAREKISYSKEVDNEDPFGFEGVQQELFPPSGKQPSKFQLAHEKRMGRQIPPWSHWLGQMYQAMRRYERIGVHLAEPATRLLNDLEPAYWRLTQELHRPFTITDENGDIKYDPNHPVMLVLQNKHPQSKRGLQALENLRMWAQENETPVVTKDQEGKTVVHEKAAKKVQQELAGLDPVVQQGVLEGIASLVDGYRRSAELRYGAELESVQTQVAKFFMLRDRGMYWDSAFGHAQLAVDGAVALQRARLEVQTLQAKLQGLQSQQAAAPLAPGAVSPEVAQVNVMLQRALQQLNHTTADYTRRLEGLNPDQVAAMENYILGVGGVANGIISMADMLKAREGWFMSEARPGRYLVFAKTPEGKPYANGRREKRFAETLEKELAEKRYTDIETVDREAQDAQRLYDSPDAVVNSFIKLEQGAWKKFLESIRGKMSEQDMAQLEADYTPGLTSQRFIENKSLDRYLQQRKLIAGREDLNSFEAFTDYTRRLVGTVARRGVRQQMDLLLRDSRVTKQGEFQGVVREAMNTLMQPVSDDFMTVRSAVTATFLGFPNLVSPIVESTQLLTTVFPELVREGKSYMGAIARFRDAPLHVGRYYDAASTLEGRRLIEAAKRKEVTDPRTMTKEEAFAYYYRRSKDEGRFAHGVVQQTMLARDSELLGQWAFGMGLGGATPKTKSELAKDSVYWLSQMAMRPYSKVSSFNNQVAFMAALDMYYDAGFRGRELYERAHVFKDRATFGGGKPNEVGYVGKLANPRTRSWFSLINTLQRYSFGSLTQQKDYVADTIGTTGLSGQDRAAAAKALTHSLGVQFVLAGAMGLPGAMIGAAVFEKMFGIDIKQAMREFWFDLAKRLGADDPMAVLVANVAQNGAPAQFLGTDLSSRFTVNSFLGFDAFEGFDTTNLLGPTAGIVERLIKAGQYVKDGKMVQASKMALPPSLTPMIDLSNQYADYGTAGIRGANGQLLRPMSATEQGLYGIGVRPYGYRQFRDQQQALKNAEASYDNVRSQKVDTAADALSKGDAKPAFEWVREYMAKTPSANPRDALKSVVDRALVQTNAQDLLARTPVGTEARAAEISRTFGNAAPRQSETQLLLQREKLNASTGYAAGDPASADDMTRAQLVNALVKSKGIPRSEAVRLVQAMGY